jgi:hypothetical protein
LPSPDAESYPAVALYAGPRGPLPAIARCPVIRSATGGQAALPASDKKSAAILVFQPQRRRGASRKRKLYAHKDRRYSPGFARGGDAEIAGDLRDGLACLFESMNLRGLRKPNYVVPGIVDGYLGVTVPNCLYPNTSANPKHLRLDRSRTHQRFIDNGL